VGINEVSKAIFLDRDGVVNKSVVKDGKPYPPASIKDLEIIDGVKEGIEKLKKNGFKIFIVTNQPDVARGNTLPGNVQAINTFLERELSINGVYCCLHDDMDDCECRKPKPGMILEAAKTWNIDLSRSFMIGDRWRDIEAGKRAGVTSILIDYNYDEKKVAADFECSNFSEAVYFILNSNQNKVI